MHRLFILGLFVSLAMCVQAQKFDWRSREVKSDTDLLKTTVATETLLRGDDNKAAKGTAFFFYNIRTDSLYLITNAHVVNVGDNFLFTVKSSGASINSPNERFVIRNLQEYIQYAVDRENRSYDLAFINLSKLNLRIEQFSFCVFTENNLPKQNQQKNLLFQDNIYTLGYPANVQDLPLSYPFVIKTPMAVPYNFNPMGWKEFCVNGNLVQGCSGSPVISVDRNGVGEKYTLLGVDYFAYNQFKNIGTLILDHGINARGLKNEIDTLGVSHEIFLSQCIKSEVITDLLNTSTNTSSHQQKGNNHLSEGYKKRKIP